MYRRVIARVACVAAFGFTSACGTEPSVLHLDIALDKEVVAISDSVHLTLTLSNVSPRTVRVVAADAYGICMHAFEVFDAQERRVAPPSAFCLAAVAFIGPSFVELGPLERITYRDWWNVGGSRVDEQPLTPGIYRIRGAVGGDGGLVHSNAITVGVFPDN